MRMHIFTGIWVMAFQLCNEDDQQKIIERGAQHGYAIQHAGQISKGRTVSPQVGKTKTNITHSY